MQSPTDSNKLPARRRWLAGGLALALILGGSAVWRLWRGGPADGGPQDLPVIAVQRGPLNINLIENGSIQSRDRVVVRSDVSGRNTILSLVEEGRFVHKGDLLVELDSSGFEQNRVDQQMRVENAEALWVQARENLDITRNQAISDMDDAGLAMKFSKLEQEKYEKGEYQQQLRQATADITIANEELQRARERVVWSRKLASQGYFTREELSADELAARRRELDLKLAEGKLLVLTNYTHTQQSEQLASDIRKSELSHERIKRRATSDVVRADAELRARESEYSRQKRRLETILESIEKCRIAAPSDGMVVYATTVQGRRWDAEPLRAGAAVVERQELIYLPATSEMMAVLQIQEASLSKVHTGLTARIRVDALPDRTYQGRVTRIAILPNTGQSWLNPDLKVYDVEVYLDNGDTALRPGMSCQVEVLIDRYEDAFFAPVQCITRENGKSIVHVLENGKPAPREVEVGLDNNRMIHILSGVREGEQLLLAPPLPASVQEAEAAPPPPPPLPASPGAAAGKGPGKKAP